MSKVSEVKKLKASIPILNSKVEVKVKEKRCPLPTPTFLYKITRKISELLGLWIFHDERPLKIDEVLGTANKHGELLEKRIGSSKKFVGRNKV